MSAFLPRLEFAFGWLLAASWQASVLALAVLAIQGLFGARLNPRWRYALWLLVVLRLVLPVLPESAFSLFQFAPPPPAALTVSVTEPLFVAAPAAPAVDVPVRIASPTPSLSLFSLLALGWLTGALGLLLLTLIVNRRFAKHVAHSPEISDPELLRLFAEAKAEFHIRREIRLIENSQVQSPAIMGLFHPALLLPVNVRQNFDPRELRFIFLHELAHLKRGDVFIQALIALLQILHWFNPVLWFAFRRMRIDREPATDALVLSRTGEDEKERYGLMLIKLLEHFNQRHSLATLVGILEDKDQFKRRFGLIAKFTRSAYGWSLLGVVILAALAIAGLTQAQRAAFKRDPSLPLVIDLKPWYFRVFTDPAGSDSAYKGYAGMKTIDGLPFTIGGQVELWGKETADRGKVFPEKIEGIRIDRKFDELHLVHAADWRDYYDCPVANIRLNYADGTKAVLTIRYNQHVNDRSRLFTEDAEIIDDPGTKIIWRGPGGAEGTGRLFKSVLENPFPGKKVVTMDLLATHSNCGYMLVAATVAQREPGRAVTPPMPLLPARHFLGQVKVHVVDKKTGAPIAGAEIYPAMVTGDISLVADNQVTGADGTTVVNYPTGGETIAPGSGDATDPKYPKKGASDLRLKITRAGYNDCEIHWMNGWNAGEIPQEITYRLTPVGVTDATGPDFTVTGPAHPTVLAAVKQGDAEGLQKLIDGGAEVPKVDDQGELLIFSAGSAAVMEILLKHGADPNALNKYQRSVIANVCLTRGSQAAAMVEVLLQHGVDPNLRTGEEGSTPLMEARDAATVDVLVAHGADVKAKRNDGVGIMEMISGQKPDYLDALIRHGVPFDPKTDGPSMLVHTAWVNNVAMTRAVLDRGVDPNLPGLWAMFHGKPDMMKPMVSAMVEGHLEVAKVLLEHGAKVDDNSIRTALGNRQAKAMKFFWENHIRPISELAYAVTQGAPVADLEKLLDAGMPADPPQDAAYSNPLEIAAQLGNFDAVKLLVSRGAKVNDAKAARSGNSTTGSSALFAAASEGQDEIVSYLLAHGATPDAASLAQAAENSTPYQDQKSKEHFEKCVRILIDAGALKNATPDDKGMILASAIGTRQGPSNLTVMKMALDAGISPESPMPYIVQNGEKPNSVIGYYREQYQKDKDDPARASAAAEMKPALDMLEAVEKGEPSTSAPTEAVTFSPIKETSQTGESGSPISSPITLVATVVEIKEQAFEHDQAAMEMAVKSGDEKFFENRKDTYVAPSFEIKFAHNKGWYSAGMAQTFVGSVTYDKPNGVLSTTIQASALFVGFGADFSISSSAQNGVSIDSTWSDMEPEALSAQKYDPNFTPAKVPITLDLMPTLAKAKYTDTGWRPELGKVHGFWVGQTLGQFARTAQFRDRSHASIAEMVKLKTPSRLAVFLVRKEPSVPPASSATVSGQLTIPVAAHPDFAKSTGVLVSDAGAQYPIAFDGAGKFVVTGVAAGRYRAVVHVVCEPRDHVVGVDKTFGFTEVGAGSQAALNVAWDPTPPAKDGIEIELRVVQIDEDVYQANKAKIDAGVEKGGAEIIGLLYQTKGVSLLSAPSVTTKPGQKANVDIVREMPYPTEFDRPKVTAFVAGTASDQTNMVAYTSPTPRQFQTKNIGVSAEVTPSLIGKTLSAQGSVMPDRIMLSGTFSVAEFEGFTQSNIAPTSTPTFNTSESHFIEAVADGELKGVWIPGSHYRTADAPNPLPNLKIDPNAPTIKTRYLLFLSAKEVD